MLHTLIHSRIVCITNYLSVVLLISNAHYLFAHWQQHSKPAVSGDLLSLLAVYTGIVLALIVDVKQIVICLLILSVTHTN